VRHDRPGLRDKLDPRVVNADDPFQGDREICVLFDGVRYRLRITRRNRLILQK
jgi:hemin uptake protein HemP